ncbi:hypothetical protein [Hymenobacter qilianensis]|nr:hypothetical protein [Hymenobacter qilianensis]
MLKVKAQIGMMRQPNNVGVRNNAYGFMLYRYPLDPARGFDLARNSFASAVAVLAQLTGHVPREVRVVKLTEVG